jgi:hypothetical protein
LQDWFEFKIPKINFWNYIFNALEVADDFNIKPAKIVWLGGKPSVEYFTKSKGNSWDMMSLTFHDKESFTIQTNKQEGEWLVLDKIAAIALRFLTFQGN